MQGKRVLITGSTAGIGKAAARQLAGAGAQVIVHGRDQAKVDLAINEIRSATGSHSVTPLLCDLSQLPDVRRAATKLRSGPPLDAIICNAGVFLPRRELTTEGHERTFATVHLGHFLLTQLLLDHLKQAEQGRVIFVGPPPGMAKVFFDDLTLAKGYSTLKAVNHAKGAMLMCMRELARRLEGTRVTANSMLPGYMIKTELHLKMPWAMRFFISLFGITSEKAAAPQAWLASDPELAKVSGRHFHRFTQQQIKGQAADDAACRRMWDLSVSLVGL